MGKININLLPVEIEAAKKEEGKKSVLVKSSISLLLFILVLTFCTLLYRVYQVVDLSNITNNLKTAKAKVEGLKEQEGLILILKDRITQISTLVRTESQAPRAFNLIINQMPSDIVLINFDVSTDGTVNLEGETSNPSSLQAFFNNLIDPIKTEGSIKEVRVENLAQSVNGNIRFNLFIALSGNKSIK